MAQPHAVIIGGGVGGLTAAVALHDRGWAVTVCEPSTSPGAVDTGLGILPNGLRVLRALGVGEAFHAAAAWPPTVELRRADGRVLLRLEQERLTRWYGAAVAVVSRSALLRLLAARLPAGAIHVGVTVTELHVGDIHQRAHVRTTAGDLAADLVVAADGVHSRMRALLFPRHPEPTYAGFTTWRFLTPAPVHAVPAGETWGSGASFGVLPLPDGRAYCYATATAPAGQRSADERAELLRLFGSWHDPIPALVRAVPAQAVVRADAWVADDPLPAYHSGRVALVGDAAHAAPPNLDLGVCLAMEDAVVLAHRASGSAAYLPTALTSYTDDRIQRTSRVVQRVAQFAEMARTASPALVRFRDAGIRAVGAFAAHQVAQRYLDSLVEWEPPRQSALL